MLMYVHAYNFFSPIALCDHRMIMIASAVISHIFPFEKQPKNAIKISGSISGLQKTQMRNATSQATLANRMACSMQQKNCFYACIVLLFHSFSKSKPKRQFIFLSWISWFGGVVGKLALSQQIEICESAGLRV